MVEIINGVAMNNGSIKEDITLRGVFEERDRMGKLTSRRVRAEEFQIQNGVGIKAVAQKKCMNLRKVFDVSRFVK